MSSVGTFGFHCPRLSRWFLHGTDPGEQLPAWLLLQFLQVSIRLRSVKLPWAAVAEPGPARRRWSLQSWVCRGLWFGACDLCHTWTSETSPRGITLQGHARGLEGRQVCNSFPASRLYSDSRKPVK